MANIKPRLWVFGVVTGCFVRHLRFPHLITDGAIKGKNTCCIADVTKGQRVISETCHFNRLSSVILADFSSGSRAFLFLGMIRRSRGRGLQGFRRCRACSIASCIAGAVRQKQIKFPQMHRQVASAGGEAQTLAER